MPIGELPDGGRWAAREANDLALRFAERGVRGTERIGKTLAADPQRHARASGKGSTARAGPAPRGTPNACA